MAYLGDYTEDFATLNFKFTSRQFSTGAPFTLGGTPVLSVYIANSTTQITTGITLTVDFDTVTGLNHVLIDLSSSASYAIGTDYQVVITTGTVDSISVVGETVATFSIENRFEYDGSKFPGYDAIIYVKKAGNDSNDGSEALPLLTLGAAKTAAGAGDLIVVGPGTYDESGLSKDEVDWYFERGAKVIKSTGTADLFDDGAASMQYNILGFGHFENNGTSGDIITVNNLTSRVYFESVYISASVGRGLVNGNGYLKVKGEYISARDGATDSISANATSIIECDQLISTAGFAIENDEGFQYVKARRVQGVADVAIEMASAGGTVIVDDAEMKSANNGCVNITVVCTVILRNCHLDSSGGYSVLFSAAADVYLLGCTREGGIFQRATANIFRETRDVNIEEISLDSVAADNLELDYDGTGYTKANSTIGTTTTNTDMRGTDGANTVVPMTSALSQIEHDATQSAITGLNDIAATDIVSAGAINTLAGAVVNVDLVDITTDVTNQVSADMTAISGDSVAADNLESTYDGTGYVDGVAPATQDQIGSITNSGSAVNTTAATYALTIGTQSSGTFNSTEALDGVNHEHTDTAGAMDLYYEFHIGSGSPSSVTLQGYLNGNNDNLEVYGYDWVAAGWVRIGTLNGKAASTNDPHSYDLTTVMVGTGTDLGKVRVRFFDGAFTLTSATLAIDRLLLAFNIGQGGYLDGIEVDTNGSNTNTVPGVDGIKGNPVSTWAAALTLSASTGIEQFNILNGSAITLTAAITNFTIIGKEWTLALASQAITSAHIEGATVSGISSGDNAHFERCSIGTCSVQICEMDRCKLAGDITLLSAGTYLFDNCSSAVAGSGTPSVDFGLAVGNTAFNNRHYSGGIEIKLYNVSGTDTMSMEGHGQLVVNANCTGGDVVLRGHFTITDNASGAVTFTDDARFTRSSGYENSSIWYDDTASNTNTVRWTDGTADNPVSTWAAVLSLFASTGFKKAHIANASTVTLTANSDSYTLWGVNWRLALGGQSIADAAFEGCDISGVSSGDNVRLQDCRFTSTGTTIGTLWASGCRLAGTITLISTGGHFFQSCFSSTGTLPIIDLGALGAQTICLTPLTGGVQINNTAAADLVHVEGQGEITLHSSCNGGTLEYAGNWRLTDNSTAITLSPDDNTSGIADTLADTNELQTDWVNGGRLDLILDDIPNTSEFNARTILAAAYFDPAVDVTLSNVTQYLGTTIVETTSGNISANFDNFYDNADALTTKVVDNVGAGGGGGLTSQQVRDAMKLAPTAGAPSAGSVDEHLDVINVDTTTDIPADIAALNDFDPATDTVANVTLVATTTTNTDMRGTDNAATAVDLATVDTNVDAIKAKTDQFVFTVANQVDANALTGGGGDDAATIYSYFIAGSNEDAFKADVSGLATSASIAALNDFDPTTDTVANVTLVATTTTNTDMRGTDNALLAASAPSNWNSLAISATGIVNANLEEISGSAIVESSAGRIVGNFNTFYDNVNVASGQTQDDVGAGAGGSFWSATEQANIRQALGVDGAKTAGGTDGDVQDIKTTTDQFVFTVPNQVDANALSGGGTSSACDEVLAKLSNTSILNIDSPQPNKITIVRGDSYDGTAHPSFTWDAEKDLTGATVRFTIRDGRTDAVIFTAAGTVAGTVAIVSLTSAQTNILKIARHKFDTEVTFAGGSIQTIALGQANVVEDQTRN